MTSSPNTTAPDTASAATPAPRPVPPPRRIVLPAVAPAGRRGTPPPGLSDADAGRIAAAIGAARTESTRRVYAYLWGQWARWCTTRGLNPLPGDPAALCAYLTERAAAGTAVSSLDLACTAIRYVHRMHDAPDPVASPTVRQVRLGIRRTYGTAPRRLARPLSTDDIRQILRWPASGTTDPVAALAAWRQLRGHHPGPLFTRLFHTQISLHALSGDAIPRMLGTRAHAAGLDAGRISAHSLRAEHATTAAHGGVPLARIAAQTRHQDLSVLVNRYIRPLEALSTTSSRDLGL